MFGVHHPVEPPSKSGPVDFATSRIRTSSESLEAGSCGNNPGPSSRTASGYAGKCYWPGVDQSELEHGAAAAGHEVVRFFAKGQPIWYLGSLLFPADDLVVCIFETPERESCKQHGGACPHPL